jgi:AmiR/NasT family two-component response regulator
VSSKTSDGSPRRPSGLDGSPQMDGRRPRVQTAIFRPDGHADVLERMGAEVARLTDHLALANEQLGHLRTALATNRRIGMAIGILMALRKIGEEEAFELLRRTSSHRNVKLRLVAEDVIRTGALD